MLCFANRYSACPPLVLSAWFHRPICPLFDKWGFKSLRVTSAGNVFDISSTSGIVNSSARVFNMICHNATLQLTSQPQSRGAPRNMEIYAYTLQSNITIDVKKKRRGYPSSSKPHNVNRQTTKEATSTRNACQNQI